MVDTNNTSGLFPDTTDGVVALYTLYNPGSQVQNLAISYDGGYTFSEYEGNPIIDIGSDQFRDPKVVWYEDHWVMVIAYSVDFTIGIYTSPNLKDWTHASNFTHQGLLGLQYECPNLVPIPFSNNGTLTGEQVWTMIISINPGSPQGGSIGQYFPGTFDGYTFKADDGAYRQTDFAKDNYAEQWFYGSEESVSIAWASNWQYTNNVPTGDEGWRSAMSLPRKNYLTKVERLGWELVSVPYNLDPILGRSLFGDSITNQSVDIDYTNGTGALHFEVNITSLGEPLATTALNLTFTSASGDKLKAGYVFSGTNAGTVYIDRRGTKGYGEDDPFFTDRFSSTAVALAESLSGVIDRSMLELFVDMGETSGTSVFYAQDSLSMMTVAAVDFPSDANVRLSVREINSVW